MITVDGIDFSGFLPLEEVQTTYRVSAERVQKLVKKGHLKTYCLPSEEKVYSKNEVEKALKKD